MKLFPTAALMVTITLLTGCICTRHVAKEPALLKITGVIDGSDRFVFTQEGVYWNHLHWSAPTQMTFAGEAWPNLTRSPQAWSQFSDLDLSNARIVKRTGRDVIALEPTTNGFALYFSDSLNGADDYTVEIAIPQGKKKRAKTGMR
ncbi:MAG TPA: hypothetical protein VK968_05220 [Roseimicrobium sp.]|nr:hypothetical protein [Roseimicrobium sp.]